MSRIIFTNDDGGVSILIPSPEHLTALMDANKDMTSAEAVEDIAVKDVPNGKSFDIVDDSMIPTDRAFRNAWEKSGATVITDMPKAILLAHDIRRAARDEEMAPLDIEATIPSKAAAAESARQVIRDKYTTMQNDIDNSSDESELKTALGI